MGGSEDEVESDCPLEFSSGFKVELSSHFTGHKTKAWRVGGSQSIIQVWQGALQPFPGPVTEHRHTCPGKPSILSLQGVGSQPILLIAFRD